MSDAKPIVIYLAGVGHSGSTLLDLLLSSHPEVTSVGEAKNLRLRPDVRCTCGAADRDACPFWQTVASGIRARVGASLAELDVLGEGSEFAAHNRALFESVVEASRRRVVVDSSKSELRLARLLETPGLDVRPVHLLRAPAAVAYSQNRKGRSGLRSAWHWRRTTAAISAILRDRSHVTLRYEALVANPASALSRILSPVGLAFRAEQLAWAGQERHNLGGNRLRWSPDARIEEDLEWRGALGPLRRFVLDAIAQGGQRRAERGGP